MSTTASEFDHVASVDAHGNLAPIVVDRLDERYPNSAQTGERINAVEAAVGQRVHVGDTYVGVTQQPGATMKDKLHAACAQASLTGATVLLPPGIIDVGTGFSMAGYRCGLMGHGASGRWGSDAYTKDLTGSTLWASQQSGPVLDFAGFDWNGANGLPQFRNFRVRGSGESDPTKGNIGMWLRDSRSGGSAVTNARFQDIIIRDTGGPALAGEVIYFCRFDNVSVWLPVGAAANDVPAVHFRNASSNNMDFTLYGGRTDYAMPQSGGVRITEWVNPDSTKSYDCQDNTLTVRVEHFSVPAGASVLHYAGGFSQLRFFAWDPVLPDAPTGSCLVRLASPDAGNNYGGNTLSGYIHGDNGAARTVECGVSVEQNGNRIEGTRGYEENNVHIQPGVSGTYVCLGGASRGLSPTSGIVDKSGLPRQNTLLDYSRYPVDGKSDMIVADAPVSVTGTAMTTVLATSWSAIKPGTYKATLDMEYTADPGADLAMKLGGFPSDTTWEVSAEGLPTSATGTSDLVQRVHKAGTGTSAPLDFGGVGAPTTCRAVIRFTVTKSGYRFAVNVGQKIANAASPTVVHAGSTVRVEQIA